MAKGYVVTYLNKKNEKVIAELFFHEQKDFEPHRKAFLHLRDSDGAPVLDENGKAKVAVNAVSDLIRIGFID